MQWELILNKLYSLLQNVLQALDSLNWHRKDNRATVVTKYFAKITILFYSVDKDIYVCIMQFCCCKAGN